MVRLREVQTRCLQQCGGVLCTLMPILGVEYFAGDRLPRASLYCCSFLQKKPSVLVACCDSDDSIVQRVYRFKSGIFPEHELHERLYLHVCAERL